MVNAAFQSSRRDARRLPTAHGHQGATEARRSASRGEVRPQTTLPTSPTGRSRRYERRTSAKLCRSLRLASHRSLGKLDSHRAFRGVIGLAYCAPGCSAPSVSTS
jgi:hypothetical protein